MNKKHDKDFLMSRKYATFVANEYAKRIEKAIKLLKEVGCFDEETKTFCDDVWEELPKLLNILQGSDKDE